MGGGDREHVYRKILNYTMMGIQQKYLWGKYIGKTHPQTPRPCHMVKEFWLVFLELPSE